MKFVYKFDRFMDMDRLQREFNGDAIREGDEVLVYSQLDTMTGKEYFYISKRFARDGYPGNMDSSVKRYHGWRGSNNNVATYAHGVYTIKSVSYEDGEIPDMYIKVVLNRKDIRKGGD